MLGELQLIENGATKSGIDCIGAKRIAVDCIRGKQDSCLSPDAEARRSGAVCSDVKSHPLLLEQPSHFLHLKKVGEGVEGGSPGIS